MDQWQAGERAWQQLRQGIGLFTPQGTLNTRAQAEAVMAAVLPQLAGPVWAKLRRRLTRPQLLTFLDRVQEHLPSLPLAPALREGALRGRSAAPYGRAPAADRTAALVRVVRLAAAVALAGWRGSGAGAGGGASGAASGVAREQPGGRRQQRAAHAAGAAPATNAGASWTSSDCIGTAGRSVPAAARARLPTSASGVRLPGGGWWACSSSHRTSCATTVHGSAARWKVPCNLG